MPYSKIRTGKNKTMISRSTSYLIMDWLSSDNFATQQSAYISRRQEDTGLWFFDSNEFTKWAHGTHQTLFCPGIPGAGKTMIAATAVHYLQTPAQTHQVGVTYLYCNYKRQAEQTIPNLIAAVLKQLVHDRPSIVQPLSSLYQKHRGQGTRSSLGDFVKVLKPVITNYSKVYIVLDALDECPE